MRRSLRYMALGVLTASLLSGNALTALADQDVNHGPGVSQAPEVSQEAPGVSGDTTQNGPGIIVEPGSGTGGQESSQIVFCWEVQVTPFRSATLFASA